MASLIFFESTPGATGSAWTSILTSGGGVASVSGLARTRDPLIVALALWLASQAALHTVFGSSLFLYSCQWTFAVIALTAVGIDRVAPKRGVDAALLALVAVQAWTNMLFLLEILRLFAQSR